MLATSLLSVPAAAALDVDWRAPGDCPPPEALTEVLAPLDGRAEVSLDAVNDGWRVTVRFTEPSPGEREVEAGSCEEAAHAALLLLRLGSGEAPAAPPPEEPPAPEVETEEVPPTPEPPPVPWRFSVTGGVALDVGTAPQPEPRLTVSAAVSRGLFRGALDVRVGLPAAWSDSLRVHRAFEAQAAGCLNFEPGPVVLAPCAAVAAGTWSATRNRTTGHSAVVSMGPQLRFHVPLEVGLEFGALAGLRFNLVRPEPFDGGGVIFTTPVAAADFQLTAGWRW